MKHLATFIILCAIPLLAFSVNNNQNDKKLSLTPKAKDGNCLDSERYLRCGNDDSVLNCICYKNGTCVSDYMSRCYACSDTNVKSVKEGCCSKSETKTPRMDGVCAPEERHQACFAYRPVASCICYMNGTCVNGKADRCNDCSNRDIFSIYEGKCKEKVLSGKDDICTPGSRAVRCFANLPELSCVCYADGTCATEKADKCVSCSNEEIVSVRKVAVLLQQLNQPHQLHPQNAAALLWKNALSCLAL